MKNKYDEVPYLGYVHRQTHIENIALVAALFQVPYPSFNGATVLEIGCGDGTNLINMAYQLPDTSFYGFDASKVQIDHGCELIERSGLSNVKLAQLFVVDFDKSIGQFDYIICHGVFSWVEDEVRSQILRLIKSHLKPNGIAYLSYNVLPGWNMYGMIRDMMLFHTRGIDDHDERVMQAHAMLQFIGKHNLSSNDPYGQFMSNTMKDIAKMDHSYVFHEYLEEHNKAFYFHEFWNLINSHGLQYLGDTEFNGMSNHNFPEESKAILDSIAGNIHDMEQYMDFLRCRRFRCSLLMHDGFDIARDVTLVPFQYFYFSFHPDANERSNMPTSTQLNAMLMQLAFADGASAAEHPIYKEALVFLSEAWPSRKHFDEIVGAIQSNLSRLISAEELADLCALLQALFLKGMLDAHLYRPTICNEISAFPKVSSLQRLVATKSNMICSQTHKSLHLYRPASLAVITKMDGTHSIDALQAAMEQAITDVEPDSQESASERLQHLLNDLLCNGALVG